MTPIVIGEGVKLVHRYHLGGRSELHAYLQQFNGELKAHVRLVNIRKDGGIRYTGKGIAVPLELLPQLLQAVALLAVEGQAVGGPQQ
jgi:hypothetical protein